MSNCLCVKVGKKLEYYSMRWKDGELQVYHEKENAWVNVVQTKERTSYGDAIFEKKG